MENNKLRKIESRIKDLRNFIDVNEKDLKILKDDFEKGVDCTGGIGYMNGYITAMKDEIQFLDELMMVNKVVDEIIESGETTLKISKDEEKKEASRRRAELYGSLLKEIEEKLGR